jgi:hypothetical protein
VFLVQGLLMLTSYHRQVAYCLSEAKTLFYISAPAMGTGGLGTSVGIFLAKIHCLFVRCMCTTFFSEQLFSTRRLTRALRL